MEPFDPDRVPWHARKVVLVRALRANLHRTHAVRGSAWAPRCPQRGALQTGNSRTVPARPRRRLGSLDLPGPRRPGSDQLAVLAGPLPPVAFRPLRARDGMAVSRVHVPVHAFYNIAILLALVRASRIENPLCPTCYVAPRSEHVARPSGSIRAPRLRTVALPVRSMSRRNAHSRASLLRVEDR